MSTTLLDALSARAQASLLAACLVVVSALGAVGVWRWLPADVARHATFFELGDRLLEFDPRLLRSGPQRSGGRVDRIDLILDSQDFGPAQLVMRDDQGLPVAPSAEAHILIALQASDGPDPADRAVQVYGRFVEPEIWSNPGGLIARRFKASSPYNGEELVMSPDSKEFVARCPRPAMSSLISLTGSSRCLVQFRIAGVDARASFDPSLLPQWPRLREGVIGLVARALR